MNDTYRHFVIIGPFFALALTLTGGARAAELETSSLQPFLPGSCCLIDIEAELEFGDALASGDFNNDGWDDLVIAAPHATVSGITGAGKVAILPGTALGPTTAGQVALVEADFGGTAELNDEFGKTLITADFNGDGADDLAIGVPQNKSGDYYSGGVYVIYGDPTGSALFIDDKEYWSYGTVNLGGFASGGEDFGSAMAIGNFNGDSYTDLAIGAPGDDVSGENYAGSITILMGSGTGLHPGGGNTFHRANISDLPQESELFGRALAAGDFDGDGDHELAIGAPGRHIDGVLWVGEVVVLDFVADGAGVSWVGKTVRSEGNGIPGAIEPQDNYGRALAAGDFNGDGADDLIVGSRNEEVQGKDAAGAFAVFTSTPGAGLPATGSLYTQNNLPGQEARAQEYFGANFAVGDFTGNGVDDLIVGAYGDRKLLVTPSGFWEWLQVGAVHIIPGARTYGLVLFLADTVFNTSTDGFGGALAAGRFQGGGADDLAIGAASYDSPMFETGRVFVAYSSSFFANGFETGDFSHWSTVVGD